MNVLTDQQLILSTRQGKVSAFGELVTRYQSNVFNVCYRMMHQRTEAEDLTQETFLRAYKRLDQFDLERPFGPWIKRIAANICLNKIESEKINPVELDDERSTSVHQHPESIVETREANQQIRQALGSLPAHYKAVIELRHFQDLSYTEIAETLNMQLSDVKSNLFRARKLLAEKLKS